MDKEERDASEIVSREFDEISKGKVVNTPYMQAIARILDKPFGRLTAEDVSDFEKDLEEIERDTGKPEEGIEFRKGTAIISLPKVMTVELKHGDSLINLLCTDSLCQASYHVLREEECVFGRIVYNARTNKTIEFLNEEKVREVPGCKCDDGCKIRYSTD
jgi:hypothetical protein